MLKSRLDIVDFHSHILPGADHGSSTLETSLFQLREAARRSVKRIIATPHFYPMNDDVDTFLERRRASCDILRPALTEELPQIKLGAEVMMCTGLERLPGLDRLFVSGTSTMLVELPLSDFQAEYADSVLRLTESGVDVILAHPERYSPHAVEAMIESGARLQCNAYSVARASKIKQIRSWIADEHIVALGSDIHQCDSSAYHNFVKAILKLDGYAEFVKEQTDIIWNSADNTL